MITIEGFRGPSRGGHGLVFYGEAGSTGSGWAAAAKPRGEASPARLPLRHVAFPWVRPPSPPPILYRLGWRRLGTNTVNRAAHYVS